MRCVLCTPTPHSSDCPLHTLLCGASAVSSSSCVCVRWMERGNHRGRGRGGGRGNVHTQGRWPPGALPSALVECLHGKGRGVGVPPGPNAGQLPVTKVDLMGLLLGVKVVTVPSAAYAPTPSCTVPHTHQAPTYLLCPLPPTPSRPYPAQHCLHVFVCHPTPRLERARKRARACERERERAR